MTTISAGNDACTYAFLAVFVLQELCKLQYEPLLQVLSMVQPLLCESNAFEAGYDEP